MGRIKLLFHALKSEALESSSVIPSKVWRDGDEMGNINCEEKDLMDIKM